MRAAALAALVGGAAAAPRPNVLFLLTDDQDIKLGSMDEGGPMKELRARVAAKGAWFENGFAHVPICCPSRASIFTGRYMHNNGVPNNGCGGAEYVNKTEPHNFFTYAKSAGYTTFYAGKFMNNYGSPSIGGLERVPPGFDSWYGLHGNSKYYNYQVSNNGVTEAHGSDYHKDYFTDRLANRSMEFLGNVSAGVAGFSAPWLMMIGTPASHGPNDPAPQYATTYAKRTAPRTPSWNKAPQPEKAPLMQGIAPMDQNHIDTSDVFFERRWSVLRSVDDMVVRLTDQLDAMGVADHTFFLFSSDHGYHLGQFGMLYDKRTLYETDIRVPLLVRGPGVKENVRIPQAVSHADLAPTILDMIGVKTPSLMDGRSWLDFVLEGRDGGKWRNDFVIEYNGPKVGEAVDENTLKAPSFTCTADTSTETLDCTCSCEYYNATGGVFQKSPCDGKENTYKCLRTMNETEDSNYCEFDGGFVEYYDTAKDPWNMANLAIKGRTPQWKLDALHARLHAFMLCSGPECFDP